MEPVRRIRITDKEIERVFGEQNGDHVRKVFALLKEDYERRINYENVSTLDKRKVVFNVESIDEGVFQKLIDLNIIVGYFLLNDRHVTLYLA